MEDNHFKNWCIVELFGHCKISGLVSEQTIGGDSFIRVDVPETKECPMYTTFYGSKAIYSITPVSEEIARGAVRYYGVTPVSPFELNPMALDENLEDNETF